MKKNFFIFFIILNLTFFTINSEFRAPYCYILRVQFPHNLKTMPKIHAYYKGKKLLFENDFCFIPETKKQKVFLLFITNPEKPPMVKSANNLRYLKRSSNNPCKLYYIKLNQDDGDKFWTIKEESAQNLPLKIPDNAIVVLLNPEFIEGVKESPDLDISIEDNCTSIIHLPRIKLKQNISKKDLNKSFDQANLASCYLDRYHDTDFNPENIRQTDSTVISMHTC